MRIRNFLIAGVAGALLSGCAVAEDLFGSRERQIAVSEVPRPVMESARERLPGFSVEKATVDEERGELYYELEGRSEGRSYEIELTADGDVIKFKETGS